MNETSPTEAVFAVDIGGTSTRCALVARTGTVLRRERIVTDPARGIADAADRIVSVLSSIARQERVQPPAAGVSTAGPVDPATGIYNHPPNLAGWHGLTMLPALQAGLGVPVVMGHDATLAAIAETKLGARRGARDLIYLTVSTGIGAGIVAGGRPVTGSHGGAGEAGHMIVAPEGRSCGAGCPGCLEGVASGSAIASEARRRVAAGEQSEMSRDASTRDVFIAAERGDPLARALIDEAIGYLASGIANLLALLDPEVIILGGGVTEGLGSHWDQLLREVRVRALPRYRDEVPLERTTLGDDVSLLGAATIAYEAVGWEVSPPAR